MHAAYEMTHYCNDFPHLISYIHVYAPTAQFKCCCDSCGNDTKMCMRRLERSGVVRATNAWEVFQSLKMQMPLPSAKKDITKRFHISKRHQRFVCRSDQRVTDEMRQSENIIEIMGPNGDKAQKKLEGIMSMYQLRVTANTKDRRLISYRKTSCWCSKFIVRDYDACLVFNALDGGENTTWTTVDLQAEEQHLSSTPLLPEFDVVDATSSSASSFFNSNAETD